MRYCIVADGMIANIIVCADDAVAASFGAEPSYDGARVGGPYAPPPPDPPKPEPDPEPTLDERVSIMETTKANQTDVDELNEALNMILTGYTGEEAADETGA